MMIYITWSLPLPPAWVVSWSGFGQLNHPYYAGRQSGDHERIISGSLVVSFWFDKNVDRNIMNGFCLKYFSIEMYNFEISTIHCVPTTYVEGIKAL